MKIIWYRVPEIEGKTHRKTKFLKHWRKCLEMLSFYTFTINDNHMMHGSWDMEHKRQNFLSFWTLYLPMNPENQNFEKMKKMAGDIIILDKCTIHSNHIMYVFWDMEHKRQNFLSFWTVFCPFTSLWTQKIKFLKKIKKCLQILSFWTCVPYITIILCMVSEIGSVMERIFCHFRLIFCSPPPPPPNNLKNQTFEKMKKHLEILSFYRCVSYMATI